LSLKVQELPASRLFLSVPQLGTCCAGARSLKARSAALHKQACLCPSWFAADLFLAVSEEKRLHYCAMEMKAGSTRRGTLGPRHSSVHQRCPPLFWLTCPSTWGWCLRHSPHSTACVFFKQLHCKLLFAYWQYRSFCSLHRSQTVLIAVTGPFKDISCYVTSSVLPLSTCTREGCLRPTHVFSSSRHRYVRGKKETLSYSLCFRHLFLLHLSTPLGIKDIFISSCQSRFLSPCFLIFRGTILLFLL